MLNISDCPCCGQPTSAVPIETLMAIGSPMFGDMVQLLHRRAGSFVTSDVLADYIWRHCNNGGPDNPGPCISQLVTRNRQRLRAVGYDIETRFGCHGGYRLIVTHEARQ